MGMLPLRPTLLRRLPHRLRITQLLIRQGREVTEAAAQEAAACQASRAGNLAATLLLTASSIIVTTSPSLSCAFGKRPNGKSWPNKWRLRRMLLRPLLGNRALQAHFAAQLMPLQ